MKRIGERRYTHTLAARRNLHHTGFIVNLIPLPTFQFTKI